MARQSLGRGLSALLGEDTATQSESDKPAADIDIDLIVPNAQQPRTRFTDQALDELAQSISVNGVIQPIVLRKKNGKYEIVAGERRWRAAQRAGLRKVPAVVRDVSDEKLLELALIENIQRAELSPIEEAKAYRRLVDEMGMTQEMLASHVGKERSRITTSLRLLKLPDDIQKLIDEEKLSAGHGRVLLTSDDVTVQRKTARLIIETGLSVREAERALKRLSRPQPVDRKEVTVNKDPNVKAAETKLMRRFGTNVKIASKGKAGKIEIEYYNSEDLDRIFQLLMDNK
jgi:ParB family chromosome partitioning protein